MAVQSSGTISLTDIAAEFGGSTPHSLSEYYRGAGLVPSSVTAVPASGPISMSAFYSTSNITAGSQTFTTVGSNSFLVPPYTTLTIDLRGAGGGGGGSTYDGGSFVGQGNPGTAGADSATSTGMTANGGGGGQGGFGFQVPINGSPGSASGGDANTAGGGNPGGVGGNYFGNGVGGTGGSGGRVVKTYTAGSPGAPTVGGSIAINLGTGGLGGTSPGTAGTSGSSATCIISWN